MENGFDPLLDGKGQVTAGPNYPAAQKRRGGVGPSAGWFWAAFARFGLPWKRRQMHNSSPRRVLRATATDDEPLHHIAVSCKETSAITSIAESPLSWGGALPVPTARPNRERRFLRSRYLGGPAENHLPQDPSTSLPCSIRGVAG